MSFNVLTVKYLWSESILAQCTAAKPHVPWPWVSPDCPLLTALWSWEREIKGRGEFNRGQWWRLLYSFYINSFWTWTHWGELQLKTSRCSAGSHNVSLYSFRTSRKITLELWYSYLPVSRWGSGIFVRHFSFPEGGPEQNKCRVRKHMWLNRSRL